MSLKCEQRCNLERIAVTSEEQVRRACISGCEAKVQPWWISITPDSETKPRNSPFHTDALFSAKVELENNAEKIISSQMVTEKKKLSLTLLNFTATTCAWGLHVKENIVIVVIDKGSKFLCDIETEKYFFGWKKK